MKRAFLALLAIAIGAGIVFVQFSDHEYARLARAKVAEWGLDLRSDKEKKEAKQRDTKRKKPAGKAAAKGKSKKPTESASQPVSVEKPPESSDPGKSAGKPEDWGKLDTDASAAESARKINTALTTAITAARNHYTALRLDAAEKALAELPARGGDDALRAQVSELAERIRWMRRLTADIERNELADHQGVYEITLTNGRTREGRLLKQDARSVTLQGDFGINATFPREQIKALRQLPASERRAKLEAQVSEKRKSRTTALEVFRLGEYCVENGLGAKAVELIEEAGTMDGDLVTTVRNDRAASILRHWVYLTSRNSKKAEIYARRLADQYGDTPYAAQVEAILSESARARAAARAGRELDLDNPTAEAPPVEEQPPVESKPPVEVARPAGADSAMRKLEKQADAAFEKATAFADHAQPGQPDANKNNHRAIEWYKKARALYQQAMDQGGARHRERLESKLEEAGMGLYWAKKMSRLG